MNSIEISLAHRHGLVILPAYLVEQQKQIGAGKFPQAPPAEAALLHLAVHAACVMIEAHRKIGCVVDARAMALGCLAIPAS